MGGSMGKNRDFFIKSETKSKYNISNYKNKSELEFENEVIEYLTKIGGVKQWEYRSDIKTTEQLWENFKEILEINNIAKLGNRKLSTTEFDQVKRIINSIKTPYEAGQFIYGVNGVSQIEIYLDSDPTKPQFLKVFDQEKVASGDTKYQIVNQIERPRVIDGKPNRRFDITLLINGLPIIQIELKKSLHSTMESLNQMQQYIAEKQYTGIFSMLQILVAMTPHDIKYMANTTLDKFNKAFAFNWQNEIDAVPVRYWKEFADKVLSIPMAHELSTRYMILDGTKNKECIKVMRPYQVYATKRVLDKISKNDFSYGDGRLGYVWHTTGSGKTITSFKTAWLAATGNVDKVVFLVDRVALTNQTVDAYQAYDPMSRNSGSEGVILDTANVNDLHKKFSKSSHSKIIVTSIQKMSKYVKSDKFKKVDRNILFIVDEAHRSTGDGSENQGMLETIRHALPNAAWIGYTGTPKFPETRLIFGDVLHSYTIKEAIADKNVLGFNVEFKETIPAPENPSEDDIDDNIRSSVYDDHPEHVIKVVEDIFNNWKKRSNNGKYNALFTIHVGGNRASTPRAMEYFDRFMEENLKRPENERLKVAISFSQDTSNSDRQLETNTNLHRAIKTYNSMFGTAFDMTTVKQYTEDIARRLNKTSYDRNFLDLVIVVEQLLTGFDAPELNTLYIDRTLKGANLIQAYSRTNRMHNMVEKPWGNVVNYRWPKQNEYEMNKAFAIYSNRQSVDKEKSVKKLRDGNIKDGIISRPFNEILGDVKNIVEKMRGLTQDFFDNPPSEKAQEDLVDYLNEYSRLISQLKQFTEDEKGNPVSAYDNPEGFYEMIGITEDEEIRLTTVIAGELKGYKNTLVDFDYSSIHLDLVHIHDVRINYDYIVDLIAKMANEVHNNEMEEAENTKTIIENEIAKSKSEDEKEKYIKFIDKVFLGEFKFDSYPVPKDRTIINDAMDKSQRETNLKILTGFIRRWGLDNTVKPKDLKKIISKHRYGEEDLDKQGVLTSIMNEAREDYKEIADDDVQKLTWVKFRNEFRKAFYETADEIIKGE